MAMRNIIVGQSGGPTSVINSSLAGVYKTAIERGFDKVYGMLHGIQGLLDGKYVDLSTQIHSDMDIEILKRTPSAFLGSCRFKLPEIHEDIEIYEKIFEILDKLEIEAFIYIGGNDSMDTIKKLSDYAIVKGHHQKFLGVPKTIDNDLALTDHTPGFGSAAKYIAASTKEIIRDALGLTYKKKMITIIEVMGRNAGWLTGATALAKTEECEGPDLIYLPEVDFKQDEFLEDVERIWNENKNVLIAVSEGIHYADGTFVSEAKTSATDGFGHAQLGGLAAKLADVVKTAIPGVKVRPIELSLLQRCAEHCASQTDSDESFMAGQTAVKEAIAGVTDKMVGFKCTRDENGYKCEADLLDLSSVANYEKKVPVEWINERGNNVTDAYIEYALPLIQGEIQIKKENSLPRFVHLKKVLAK